MDVSLLTALLFLMVFTFLATGIPVAFALAGAATIFSLIFWGPGSYTMIVIRSFGSMTGFALIAIGLFVLMANMLSKSGIIDKLFATMRLWFGGVSGGLAVGTIVICAIFAAMCGISGAAAVAMGLMALPTMLRYNYNKHLALGAIAAGSALGVLIPPSVTMVVFCIMGGLSVGRLFAAGIIPGIILASIYIIYILIVCGFKPSLGSPLPKHERVTLGVKLKSSVSLIPPFLLIFVVLGSIFSGMASPSESAAIGALGSIVCAAINKKLTWNAFKESVYSTLKLTSMIMWIVLAASVFAAVYTGIGAPAFITEVINSLKMNRWLILILMQIVFLLLGMFLEPIGIISLTIPICLPIIVSLGFDPIWFGAVFIVNMEMSFLTPPFGFNLFYLRSVAPPEISMIDIYKGVVPFVFLQLLGLAIMIAIPELSLFLPNLIFG